MCAFGVDRRRQMDVICEAESPQKMFITGSGRESQEVTAICSAVPPPPHLPSFFQLTC